MLLESQYFMYLLYMYIHTESESLLWAYLWFLSTHHLMDYICGCHKQLMTWRLVNSPNIIQEVPQLEIMWLLPECLCMEQILQKISLEPTLLLPGIILDICRSGPSLAVIACPGFRRCGWWASRIHKRMHMPDCVSLPCLYKNLNVWNVTFLF